MIKSAVYQGNSFLGEAEIYLKNPTSNAAWTKEIRISHLSPPSTRCPPLAVLHTIATDGICLRMESRATTTSATQQTEEPSPISLLHAACLRENKTAVVSLGDVELHLVALLTRKFEKHACFWGFTVPPGLYVSCLVMLNLRCLGIVFDLDETLIVANTLRSFEDRIDALQRKINTEMDQQRVAGMLAEVKRYQDDKSVLKQYAETDQVVDNGKIFRVQSELVPPMSETQQSMIRPVIRLPERNIILTRINPGIRDTSVLVRLRPAWEDFRSYLTAKGRKRFEVYVCTMAERDYALEMWRLLDPDLNLINSNQLLERIVCVKSGMRKSLLNVFQGGVCHPKMALVIDDRLKVWDEKDQPRVHVVPAFAPYYAPQAETNSAVPVLCVARNVACNVRGSFFKDFDEAMLPRFSDTFYEDDISIIPSAPDAGNYLLSEDDPSFPNGNKDQIFFDGMADAEVERRLKDANGAPAVPPMVGNLDPRLLFCPPHVLSTSSSMVSVTAPLEILPLHNSQYPPLVAPAKQLVQPGLPDSSIQSSAREEGEVPESELDPDTRRRLLIAQHGQDTRDHTPADPPFPVRPLPAPVPPVQSSGSWLHIDREMSPREIDTVPKDFRMDLEPLRFDKKRQPYFQGMEKSSYPDRGFHEKQRYSKKAYRGYDRLRGNQSTATYEPYRADEMPIAYPSSNTRDAINAQTESRRSGSALHSENPETPTSVLEGIASKCGAKVQFRTALADTVELQFSVQVWFNGDKIGEAVGKTRKDAQNLAADHSLRTLANKYISNAMPESSATSGDMDTILPGKEIGCGETNFFGVQMQTKNDTSLDLSTSDKSRAFDAKLDGTKASSVSLTALKEYCTLEGLDLLFEDCPPVSSDAVKKMEFHAQVKIDGQLYGKGAGMSWDEAKFQAAEEALVILKSSIRQFTNQHIGSTRHQQAVSNKGLSFDFPRSLDRLPSSRYQKSGPLVP